MNNLRGAKKITGVDSKNVEANTENLIQATNNEKIKRGLSFLYNYFFSYKKFRTTHKRTIFIFVQTHKTPLIWIILKIVATRHVCM